MLASRIAVAGFWSCLVFAGDAAAAATTALDDTYLTRCNLRRAYVRKTGAWSRFDLYPSGYFAPECLMNTQATQTNYLCACEPDEPALSARVDNEEIFRDGVEDGLDKQLKNYCTEQLRKVCGPFAPTVAARVEDSFLQYCRLRAQGTRRDSLHNYFDMQCECPESKVTRRHWTLSMLAHQGQEISEAYLEMLAQKQLAQCGSKEPMRPSPELDQLFSDEQVDVAQMSCSSPEAPNHCELDWRDNLVEASCDCKGLPFTKSYEVSGEFSPQLFQENCQRDLAECIEAANKAPEDENEGEGDRVKHEAPQEARQPEVYACTLTGVRDLSPWWALLFLLGLARSKNRPRFTN